jgi:putative tryptophan/tyrosine transport system substrate-binding protein
VSGVKLHILQAKNELDLDTAFDALTKQQIRALLIASDPFFTSQRDKLASLAMNYRVATIYSFSEYAVAGGLMSYGIDLPDSYRQIGLYAGRVLKCEKPSNLPVLQPTKFEFVINIKTAKTLGLTIPSGVLAIADRVIE